jgi:hypothetical protein
MSTFLGHYLTPYQKTGTFLMHQFFDNVKLRTKLIIFFFDTPKMSTFFCPNRINVINPCTICRYRQKNNNKNHTIHYYLVFAKNAQIHFSNA